MKKQEIYKRYLVFSIGLFVNSFGISFITKADLGTSPISSIPYTLSLAFPFSLGFFTLLFSLLLLVFQILLLRRRFPRHYLLQLPVSLLLSYFIDLSLSLLAGMSPQTYGVKLLSLCIGCLILGLGVFLEIVADVVMLPGESSVNAICLAFHTDFGKTKVAMDSSMSLAAVFLGLLLFHRLAGVREGTVVAAILVGTVARFLNRKWGRWFQRCVFKPECK